jgi:hypothetical protein
MEQGTPSPEVKEIVELVIRYSLANDNDLNKTPSKITTAEIPIAQISNIDPNFLRIVLRDDNVDVEQWNVIRYFVPSMNGFKKMKENEVFIFSFYKLFKVSSCKFSNERR